MSRYRAWHVRRWNKQPFRSLDALDRMLCLAIELGPYSTPVPGVSAAGPAAMQEASGLLDLTDRVASLQQQEIVVVDMAAGIFVFLDAIDSAEPSNPNAVSAWRKAFEELPDSDALGQIDERMRRRLVSYGEDHPAKSGINADESEPGRDSGIRDTYAYIRRWDPSYQPARAGEHSRNLQETLGEGSRLVAGTFVESETESGTESESGTGTGRESDAEITAEKEPAARKGEREGDQGETIGGNLKKRGGGFQRVGAAMSKPEVLEKIAAIGKMGGQNQRPASKRRSS